MSELARSFAEEGNTLSFKAYRRMLTIDHPRSPLATTPMSADSSPLPDRPLSAGVPTASPLKTCRVVTEHEGLDLRIHIVHVWSDCLRLTTLCASFFTSIDGVLFKLASKKGDGSPTSKLALSSLAGALIFHAAAAILSYLGSLVLVRHELHDTQEITGSPGSNATTAMTHTVLADSQPTNSSSAQTPSAVQSRHVRFSEVECSAASSSATSAGARASQLFSTSHTTATEVPTLPFSSSLGIALRREMLFDYRRKVPDDSNGDSSKADAEKSAVALMLLLNKCHNVCTRFMLTGFMLAVMGVVAFVWGRLEQAIAIFGSACVGVCLVSGFGALH